MTSEEMENGDSEALYYKEIPYISGDVDQRLIITYSPKYAAYQQSIRAAQVERATAMLQHGEMKRTEK